MVTKAVKKVYVKYGTEDQIILGLLENVDLDEAVKQGEVTIKNIETGETEVYVPTPKEVKPSKTALAKQAAAKPSTVKKVVNAVKNTVKKAVGGKKK